MIYMDEAVSPRKLEEFLKKCASGEASELHTLYVYEDNKLMIALALPPYDTAQVCQVYSLSKSFTQTAIGMLYDEGRISPQDIAADILGVDYEKGSRISRLSVHHLLSMSAGHEECSMSRIIQAEDGVQAFFDMELVYEPGTHFTYDTGASWLLSAIVTKITGETLFDYLQRKLFLPMGIQDCSWDTAGGNISEGGVGLHISTDGLIKLALLYQNRGVYGGKRYLSEEWIDMASAKQMDNAENGTANWRVGYGYQMWMNDCGGYRGDGAFGQYAVILPEKKLAAAALTESANMEKQMDDVFAYLCDYKKDEAEESREVDIDHIYLPKASEQEFVIDRLYKLSENVQGFTYLAVKNIGKNLRLEISDGAKIQVVTIGNGEWIENTLYAKAVKPLLLHLMPNLRNEISRFAASYAVAEDGMIDIDIRFLNTPHHVELSAKFDDQMNIRLKKFKDELYLENAREICGRVVK